jgi:hypothetical protein
MDNPKDAPNDIATVPTMMARVIVGHILDISDVLRAECPAHRLIDALRLISNADLT